MISLNDFDYHLPPESIAQSPAVPRDSSKLMVVDRVSGELEHHTFSDLDSILRYNDVLVRNNTKVMPARLFGKKSTGGFVEVLLIKEVGVSERSISWEVLSKPGLKVGQSILFGEMEAVCTRISGYARVVEFQVSREEFFVLLDQLGKTPIPPYIGWNTDDEQTLREVYQTTYAKHLGSSAAPTAGLHFTKALDERLIAKGVEILEVTLHVGLGTFLPVKTDDVEEHHMHSEEFELTKEVAEKLTKFKKEGRRIISVGTTTTRVLESTFDAQKQQFIAQSGSTDIYIYPPYKFQAIDGIITNFHLPKSTLLMLISAFVSEPNTSHQFLDFQSSVVGKAYKEAIEKKYRFYSFGDGMLII